MADSSGRELEDQTANLFRAAGCEAGVRVGIQGPHGRDNIDVLVWFDSLGIPDMWAVECKDKGRPVERVDVLAFQKRVENIGASRGVMVSRSGYQSGALDAADKTNIVLKTPSELVRPLKELCQLAEPK
jgi:restriction endonuclease Mrr